MQRIVTGIKPTGTPHLGNYLGMIRPALELAEHHDAYYFVADCHALNTAPRPADVQHHTRVVAATLLALGLDPNRTALYRQSDVPEVFMLAVLLAAVTPKGLLNRAHAYKAAVDSNRRGGESPDHGINMGLFTYPLLMAADILGPAADLVPTGRDQRQHLDITRDIAGAFNAQVGPVLTVPDGCVDERAHTVVGTDGRKMSKSYSNTIPILARPEQLRTAVMRIVTDSTPLAAPKDPDRDATFQLYALVAPPAYVDTLRERYLAGRIGYGEAKQRLLEVLVDVFAGPRQRFAAHMADQATLTDVLEDGARRTRRLASETLERAREAVGIGRLTAPDRAGVPG